MKNRPVLIAADGYLARNPQGRDLGRKTTYTTAILRAEKAGTGSTVVAADTDGTPLTRDDGSEFVAYTVN